MSAADAESGTVAAHQVVIDSFRGEHYFLSNVYPAPTPYVGYLYPTSEHAYMAARTTDQDAITAIRSTSDALEAQRIGRAANPIDNWEQRRIAIMEEIVTAKFTRNLDLAAKLASTGGALLIEGNDWHDQTWGSCSCDQHRITPGANALGTILMAVRRRLSHRPEALDGG